MFRKDLIEMLSQGPTSVARLARLLEVHPKDVEQDIKHFLKSLKRSAYRIVVSPAQCRKCGFTFRTQKLRKPAKCPVCHGSWIEEPTLHVEEKTAGHKKLIDSGISPWAAIFDWDGVITNSIRQHQDAWERLAQEEKRSMLPDAFRKGFGMKNDRIIPEVLGWTADDTEIARLSQRKEALYRAILQEVGIETLPGVTEFLTALKAAAVPCAIASSTDYENIRVALDLIRLRDCFHVIISAEDVSRGKPDPQVFLLAAEKLAMPPTRCVVFEDAIVGIEAGHAAGMKVVAVTTTNSPAALDAADRVVTRLDQLSVRELSAWFEPR
jgi:beta-phosphoglucomutase family hydrolase